MPVKKKAMKQPRTKEKAVRIAEIQAAAKKVFFKKGYQNTTMQEIADKAKVSKGTLYLYYKGKDDLYVALMMPSLEELGRLFREVEKAILRSDVGITPNSDGKLIRLAVPPLSEERRRQIVNMDIVAHTTAIRSVEVGAIDLNLLPHPSRYFHHDR